MTRNKLGTIALGAIVSLGAMGTIHLASRAMEGQALRIVARSFTPIEADHMNVLDGLTPGQRELDMDDYCGTQCKPGSFGWRVCLDGCREGN